MFGFFKKKPEEKCESILGGEITDDKTQSENIEGGDEETNEKEQSAQSEDNEDSYTIDSDELVDSGRVLTPDVEGYVQLSDEELYFETVSVQNTELTVTLQTLSNFDTDKYLALNEQLPYEFRHYLDTRRAFAKALKNCGDDISEYEDYEGGKQSDWSTSFDYDDLSVTIDFAISRAGENELYVFSAKISAE